MRTGNKNPSDTEICEQFLSDEPDKAMMKALKIGKWACRGMVIYGALHVAQGDIVAGAWEMATIAFMSEVLSRFIRNEEIETMTVSNENETAELVTIPSQEPESMPLPAAS